MIRPGGRRFRVSSAILQMRHVLSLSVSVRKAVVSAYVPMCVHPAPSSSENCIALSVAMCSHVLSGIGSGFSQLSGPVRRRRLRLVSCRAFDRCDEQRRNDTHVLFNDSGVRILRIFFAWGGPNPNGFPHGVNTSCHGEVSFLSSSSSSFFLLNTHSLLDTPSPHYLILVNDGLRRSKTEVSRPYHPHAPPYCATKQSMQRRTINTSRSEERGGADEWSLVRQVCCPHPCVNHKDATTDLTFSHLHTFDRSL